MTEQWKYEDVCDAMHEYFEENLTEEDLEHRDVDHMEDFFVKDVALTFMRGVFRGWDLGQCIDEALCEMPTSMESARTIVDDDRD